MIAPAALSTSLIPAMRESEHLVVLTGAGVSAESGVPTFRDGAGLWESHPLDDLATPAAFVRDPELVWRFYSWRREIVAACQPNAAHRLLAEIEREAARFTLITQNVDGLHSQAGSRAIVELHGSLWRLRCTACDLRWEDRSVPLPQLPPRCTRCDSLARPDVVWFGESLASLALETAADAAHRATTLLVVGTSAQVQPAAQIPQWAVQSGAHVIEFNPRKTPVSLLAAERFELPATEGLALWWKRYRGSKTLS